ncbi:MAG TPA: FAD-dependent oxidoreductase [Acidimicrobiales bacterium]|nr:FAD-dependent oxidoreductase [Acidimicrobiales bacterium]
MAAIVITGGGVAGLSAAMLLAEDGHDVTVLERDAAEPPAPTEAWETWERRGVNQFRLLHFFAARFRVELERELPRVLTGLEAAGALRVNPIAGAPDRLTGGARPEDAGFDAVTGRRPVVEAVLGAVAAATPGVTVRRGVTVQGLVTGTPVVPGAVHVTGVRLATGEEIRADLVVDAAGRRSPLPDWLGAAGARRPVEEIEDLGFVYYGRHFRSTDGTTPPIFGPFLQSYGSVSALTLPADNGTWGIGVVASAADKAMRPLRDVERWTAVVASLPLAAHWLDGEALEDHVVVMAKIEDRHRDFTIDGVPVATGVAAVGDSWACTNPSLGRGATLGLLHCLALRDTVRATGVDDPAAFSAAWADATDTVAEPWYRATLDFDRHRLAEIDAEIRGEPYRPGDDGWDTLQALGFAAGQDPDCLRATLTLFGLLQPADEVLAAPGLLDKVRSVGGGWRHAPQLGPTRAQLLSIVSP